MLKTIGNELILFNEKLEKLFNSLSQAEIVYGINSPEYRQIKGYIAITNKVIERKIGYFDNFDNKELLKYYLEFVHEHPTVLFSSFSNVLAHPNHSLATEKAVNDIKYYYWINNCLEEETIYEDEDLINLAQDAIPLAQSNYTTELLFERLFTSTLLDYIHLAIQEQKDEEVKKVLIQIKNRLIYYFNDLLRLFIEDERYLSATGYYQTELEELIKTNSSDLDVDFLEPLLEIVNDGLRDIEQILEYSDLETPEQKAEIVFKSLYIKTALSINFSKRLQNIFGQVQLASQAKAQNTQTKEVLKETFNLEKNLSFIKN